MSSSWNEGDWQTGNVTLEKKNSKHTYLYRYLVYLVEYVDAGDVGSKK